VGLVEASGAWHLEGAGQTAAAQRPSSHEENTLEDQRPKLPLSLRPTDPSFSDKVRLPQGVDREGTRATYEDGLPVVSLPRAEAYSAKRVVIAIS
jgi:HSP20 family molecular chaperone IbpA